MESTHDMSVSLTHHATLIFGEHEHVCAAVERALGCTFRTTPDADIMYLERATCSIEDARMLAQRALQKPIVRNAMWFIIDTHTIHTEAQHALLKLTEDPPAQARFVFILPQSSPLLPTLRSRFHIIHLHTPERLPVSESAALATHLKDIAKIAKDADDTRMEELLRAAEHAVHAQPHSHAARAVLLARRYIETRGASPKMLLEHLAIAEREAL